MNEEIVSIKYDKPNDKNWLCPDNIKLALSSYCNNTKFEVERINIIDKQRIEKAIEKATLFKVNTYNNADFEGFIDKELLLKELGLI